MTMLFLPCPQRNTNLSHTLRTGTPAILHSVWISAFCVLLPLFSHVGFAHAETKTKPAEEKQNPLQGTWEWVNIKNGCTEIYIFGSNGSAHITSGTEISKAEYVISPTPSSAGYYQVKLKILQDMGGKDCSDEEIDNTGEEYTKYLMFHPAGGQYVTCDKESVDTCVGPLKRLD